MWLFNIVLSECLWTVGFSPSCLTAHGLQASPVTTVGFKPHHWKLIRLPGQAAVPQGDLSLQLVLRISGQIHGKIRPAVPVSGLSFCLQSILSSFAECPSRELGRICLMEWLWLSSGFPLLLQRHLPSARCFVPSRAVLTAPQGCPLPLQPAGTPGTRMVLGHSLWQLVRRVLLLWAHGQEPEFSSLAEEVLYPN